jgi:hypothetical protein
MKFFFALVSLLAITSTTQAKDLQFNIDVESSGNAIYACNAGIMHPNPGNRVCYYVNTKTACTPTACDSAGNCDHNCVCTGLNGGNYRQDFIRSRYGLWDSESQVGSLAKQANTNSYNQLFSDNDAWKYHLKNLSVNMGSERYGTKYFLDVCFRGSQINYWPDMDAPHQIVVRTNTSEKNSSTQNSYRVLSSVKVSTQYTCDLQGMGVYKDWGPSTYDKDLNEALFSAGDINSGKTTPVTMSGSTVNFFGNNHMINTDSRAPRFCKIRYYYDESAINNLRKWQIQQAQMHTFTSVEETEPEL